ncbi:MAG TPA: hypothetical protein PKE16_05795 [Hyphomicrobium sp.]|nr:hypothetical protein [Hyphomicrobium sp.]
MKMAILAAALLISGISGASANPHCSGDFKTSGTAQCTVVR